MVTVIFDVKNNVLSCTPLTMTIINLALKHICIPLLYPFMSLVFGRVLYHWLTCISDFLYL